MWEKRKLLWIIILGGSLIIVLSFSWLGLPWTANHLGFALPGRGGLPYRIVYAGRDYANPVTCAHADWCQSASASTGSAPLCWKVEDVRQHNDWPLIHVGAISTFFGSPYPLLIPQSLV